MGTQTMSQDFSIDQADAKDESACFSVVDPSMAPRPSITQRPPLEPILDVQKLDECVNEMRFMVARAVQKTVKLEDTNQNLQMSLKKALGKSLHEDKLAKQLSELPPVKSKEQVFELITKMNDKLVDLDQLRYIIKDKADYLTANEGMVSLTNSFNRLSNYLQVKINEIREEEEAERNDKKNADRDSDSDDNLLTDLDQSPEEDSQPIPTVSNIEMMAPAENEQEDDSEDEESMSLKDVIMTLNEFYKTKLDNLLQYLQASMGEVLMSDEELKDTERRIKDNEVKIPYDEEIFVGIDKNYKTLKKCLANVQLAHQKAKKLETLTHSIESQENQI